MSHNAKSCVILPLEATAKRKAILLDRKFVKNQRFAVGISILSVVVPKTLAFPVWAAILTLGCLTLSHLFGGALLSLRGLKLRFYTARSAIIHLK